MDFQRKRLNPTEPFIGIVQSEDGRILGKYQTRGRDLFKAEREFVREFLMKVSTQKGESEMSKKVDEVTNMCWIAGKIKTIKTGDNRAFLLIDVGENSKFLPCTVFDAPPLVDILSRYKPEDFIKIVGFVRGWSQQKNDKWENHVDVRITEVKNPKPKPQPKPAVATVEDDEVPF